VCGPKKFALLDKFAFCRSQTSSLSFFAARSHVFQQQVLVFAVLVPFECVGSLEPPALTMKQSANNGSYIDDYSYRAPNKMPKQMAVHFRLSCGYAKYCIHPSHAQCSTGISYVTISTTGWKETNVVLMLLPPLDNSRRLNPGAKRLRRKHDDG
jgi:hypothetical protein